MKTNTVVLGVLSSLLLFACGAKKGAQSEMADNQQQTTTARTGEGEIDSSTVEEEVSESASSSSAEMKDNMADSSESSSAAATASVPSSSINGMDDATMYKKLNMTDVQIESLKTKIAEFKTRQINTANGEMLGTVESEKGRILKEILSPEQYKMYQTIQKVK